MPYFSDLGYRFSAGNNPADELLDFVAGAGGGNGGNPAAAAASAALEATMDSGGSIDQSFSETANKPLLSEASRPEDVPPAPRSVAASVIRAFPAWAQPTLYQALCVEPEIVPLTPLPASSRYFEEQWKAREALVGSGGPPGTAAPGGVADMISAASPGTTVVSVGSIQQQPFNASARLARSDSAPGEALDPTALSQGRGATLLRQIILCHNRSVLQQYRNVVTYGLEMFVGLLVGALRRGGGRHS